MGVSRFVEDLVQKDYVERKSSLLKIGVLSLCIYCLKDKRDLKIEHDMYYKFKEVFEGKYQT